MSISSEIIRLETAKANIKEAIQSKGVTVPDGTKIDGMADAISAIEAGGLKMVSGSFTSNKKETQESFSVSGLVFEPKMISIKRVSYAEGNYGPGTGASLLMCAFSDFENSDGFYLSGNSTNSGNFYTSSCLSISGGDGTYTITSTREFSQYDSSSRHCYGTYSYTIYG